ncbi:DNA sulfur modification protein DndB [Neobacillus drentensis]|uniref:DNA sulfur modification protein DndB n=1 Tax=Neobacillus drentensis TaxID=220684 RepID=UPI00285E09A9|nr:DNA sulfur modification protein DndB [Neobacillus drentensis]MDR7240500.1 hypothetical protein [Neobacillus drentensis]
MIVNDVFSKQQSIAAYSILELTALIKNGQVKLREVNKLQVRAIKKYILENTNSERIYFPPIVSNVKEGSLYKGKPNEMTIIDGNQRLKALCQIEELGYRAIKSEKEEDIKKGYKLLHFLEDTKIATLIFESLSDDEVDQLYIDLNTKGKKVALSKRIAFDSRNKLNQITNKVLLSNKQLKTAGVEEEKRAVVRPNNKKLLSLSQLRQIVAIFLTGKMIYRTSDEGYEAHLDGKEYIELLNIWFYELFEMYPPEDIGDLNKSMIANNPLLLSIAYYANKGLEKRSFKDRKQEIQNRMKQLQDVNWSINNPAWKEFKGIKRSGLYFLSNDKVTMENLVKWLQKQGR